MKRSQLFTFFLTLLPHDRTGQSASSAEGEGDSIATKLKDNKIWLKSETHVFHVRGARRARCGTRQALLPAGACVAPLRMV
jgi:hypothetical protein